jgi:enolase-phosphatase E1
VIAAIDAARAADASGDAGGLLETDTEAEGQRARVRFLRRMIDQDRKLPALKELQGLIWDEGYGSGELIAPLFADVAPALRRWQERGLELAVYSSGSVRAQQLLYRHSDAGDLSGMFRHWFDTRIGPKGEEASYRAIAAVMGLEPGAILFVSDAPAELEAADAAGLQTRFSLREGNPQRDPGRFLSISSLLEIGI